MSPGLLQTELEKASRLLSRWQAELRSALWASVVFGTLCLFVLSDVFLRLSRPVRFAGWAVLLSLAGVGCYRILKALSRRRTMEGVAAIIEKAFPQLDNHLINTIQFAAHGRGDVFKQAYVRRGVPEWNQIRLQDMRDRRAFRNTFLALGAAICLLFVPGLLGGHTWAVSVLRVVNPFADIPPVTFTKIVSVDPGDAVVPRGGPLVVSCKVKGRKGHRVRLDIKPDDDKRTTYDLGRLSSGEVQTFSHRIVKVGTDLKYRFRAGDAPNTDWFSVTARPPLAFSRMTIEVVPPDYMGLKPRTFDGISDAVEIPQGSVVTLTVRGNSPLTRATARVKGIDPVELAPVDDETQEDRTGTFLVSGGEAIVLSAVNKFKESTDVSVRYKLLSDQLPSIGIQSPEGRTMLSPGVPASIAFTVSDDFGLDEVSIERISLGTAKDVDGRTVQAWTPTNSRLIEASWQDAETETDVRGPQVYRIVAVDNCPFGKRVAKSSAIIFDALGSREAADKKEAAQAKAVSTLKQIIELQRANLNQTQALKDMVSRATAEQWEDASGTQTRIRTLSYQVLRSPVNPLGSMRPVLGRLYNEEMLEVISTLSRVSKTESLTEKTDLVSRSVWLENTILRKLTQTAIGAESTDKQRKISGLLAMLDDLVKGQSAVLGSTRDYIKTAARVGESLVDQQDDLATDTSDFVKACHDSHASLGSTDKKFAELVLKVANQCEEKEVRADMLRAAEQLDENVPKDASVFEERALANLTELQRLLNEWQMANAREALEENVEALHLAEERMGKLATLQSKVVEAMRRIDAQKDASDEERDLMEEDIEELKENMEEAALQIPTDLHIFNDLTVANELVEDVYSIFEEVDRDRNEPPKSADEVESGEIAFLKEESLLEDMQKAKDRLADMEMWLAEEAEKTAWMAEAFDKEEMEFMALGALESSAEDLIGDLIEEEEDAAEEADDSATNQGKSDIAAGWEVAEGPTASFAAKGKSGNQMPDHKEQDGRSNVGREGMSAGETAAGSGTISEGDPNIEKRMTQDPLQSGQVQADGEASENATGGGKLGSGAADEMGMPGAGSERRMDSTAQGSMEGMEALMAKTQAMHVKASLLNLRTESLGEAAHHMRQANDAIAKGLPIQQIREFQKRALASLRRAKAELDVGAAAALQAERQTAILEDAVEGGSDEAPAQYRDLVAEYFKSLSDSI